MSSIKQAAIEDNVLSVLKIHLMGNINNARRGVKLAVLYESLKKNPEFSKDTAIDDILRASVVFTHATLEDFLRTLATLLLPYANEDILNQIPLSGLNSSGRAEKFFLGKLAKHKGKTVDEVIKESILESLDHSNYNNSTEIAQLLVTLGIDTTKLKPLFPEIDKLMQRRHLIVHRVDRNKQIGTNEIDLVEINLKDVIKWFEATLDLFQIVLEDFERK